MSVQKFSVSSLPLSSSVKDAIATLPADKELPSWEIVRELLESHPGYGRGLGGKLRHEKGPSVKFRRTVEGWFEELDELLDMDVLQGKSLWLNGKLTIWGLAQLDEELKTFLDGFNFLETLEKEYYGETNLFPKELLRAPAIPTESSAYSSSKATSEGGDTRQEVIEPVFSPRIAGFISDRPDQEQQDLLDIEREVQNIAHVLTFKQVQPPLALGLFGDWGSGKTFFMGKLRRYIDQVAGHYQKEEQKNKGESQWCSRVAQIEFNAWHFSDSNLWASLVTRIYEGLDRELNKEKENADKIKKRIIQAQILAAEERAAQAESQLTQAKGRVSAAQENLKDKQKDRQAKESTLQGLIGSLPSLLGGSPELEEPLKQAAKALGVPEAAETYEALEELDGQMKTLSGRMTAVTASILHSPWTLGLMVLVVFLLPVALTVLIERYGNWLGEIGQRVAETSAFLLSIAGWLKAQVAHALGYVDKVDSALQRARQVRKERIENDENVIAARNQLTEAQAEEQAAYSNLENAKGELQRLEAELQELRPERKLQRLIEMRANSGAYAQHLGIISLIRSDFENMSRILADMIDEPRDFEQLPPIQRIILYIDDLDRCRPERVVEVLEAIHLLLFFPLFIVVVAVDPRWLRHSLTRHYPATLSESGRLVLINGQAGMAQYSTPQDYLEKIFQIPFALRPVQKGGYQNLVEALLKPLPPRKRPGAASKSATEPPAGTGTAPEDGPLEGREHEPEGASAPAGEAGTSAHEGDEAPAEKAFVPFPPQQLEFTAWEKNDIHQLWPMFQTPRTIKRFINIYRLLRAGLSSDEAITAFEGTEANPGQYQVALILLAAITAFPNVATHFLFRLDAWLDVQELKEREPASWREILDFLHQAPDTRTRQVLADMQAAENSMDEREPAGNLQENALGSGQTDQNEGAQDAESSWNLLLDSLERVLQDERWNQPCELTTLRTWTMRVARFSFSVQPK